MTRVVAVKMNENTFEVHPILEKVAEILKEAWGFAADGKILAIGGVKNIPYNVGEGFLFTTPEAFEYPMVFVSVREVFWEITKDLRRVQMLVNYQIPAHVRFALSLGMTPEAFIHNIGPNGETMALFVRTQWQ